MVQKIIVGVTAAPVAARAVAWAARRAADLRQQVELIAVVGGAVGAVGEDRVAELARRGAQSLLDEHAAEVRAAGADVSTRVERGNPVAVLVDASTDAAMLVLGSDYHGREGGPARGARGIRTTAAAHCPVTVVPDIDVSSRRGVLVGTDGSPVSENAVRFAAVEAARLGEPLTAVSVWTPMPIPGPVSGYPEPYLDNMQDITAEALGVALAGLRQDFPGLEIIEHVAGGYPSAVITELAQDARLTVVGSHGRGALARLLLGSISHEVLARLVTVTSVVR